MRLWIPLAVMLPLLGAWTPTLHAQAGAIAADRPDMTESPAVAPPGHVQLEAGMSRGAYRSLSGWSSIAALLKFGLWPWLEMRVEAERLVVEEGPEGGPRLEGLTPVMVGTKLALCAEKGLRPRTALLAHLGLPEAASRQHRADRPFGTFRLAMQHTLSERSSIGYNIGSEWNGVDRTVTAIYSVSCGFDLSERIGTYGEVFGFINDAGAPVHQCDAGFTFRIGDDLLLDAEAGLAIDGSAAWFIGTGASFRLPAWRTAAPSGP